MKSILLPLLLLLFIPLAGTGQGKSTLSGYIKDKSNGEELIGATLYIAELQTGTSANVYGFYSVTVNPGKYTLQVSYVGYTTH